MIRLSQRAMSFSVSAHRGADTAAVRPMVEKLSEEISQPIYGLNCDVDEEITKRYEVETIPTLIYFHDGQPKDRIIGYGTVGYPQLKEFIEKNSK